MFGMALVWLGIGMLVAGIVYQVQFMVDLRKTRAAMTGPSPHPRRERVPVSLTLIAAIAAARHRRHGDRQHVPGGLT